jgi:hypothetical protein
LESSDVERLLKDSKTPGVKELLLLGFYSGADLGEILSLQISSFKKGSQEIVLRNRKLIIPISISDVLYKYADNRRIKGKETLWEFSDPFHAAKQYQQESFDAISKPLSWKAIRRTYLWQGSGAGLPRELLTNNSGVNYKYAEEWFQNGKNYARMVNEAKLYESGTIPKSQHRPAKRR